MGTMARGAAFALLVVLVHTSAAAANPASAALRAKAADQIYNLDRDDALHTYREAVKADPRDPAAHRGLATALWLSITFRRGNMTVDDYLGRVMKPSGPPVPPPPETAAAFTSAIDK